MSQYNEIEEECKALKRKLFDQEEFIKQVANLFPLGVGDMSEMDAADFKDKAGETWALVQDARQLVSM
jgi:hypothetical protein